MKVNLKLRDGTYKQNYKETSKANMEKVVLSITLNDKKNHIMDSRTYQIEKITYK